jgi:peptidoglycan hydrolase-like protein with peptidoglycan-binding domain
MRFNEFRENSRGFLSPEIVQGITGTAPTNNTNQRSSNVQQRNLQAGPPYPVKDRDAVTAMQTKLLDLGYNLGTVGPRGNGIDGKYGPRTERAVKAYKKDFNVRDTDNGRTMSAADIEKLQQAEPKVAPSSTGNERRQGRGSSSSSDGAGGVQPGSLEGTSVLALNPDAGELPGQNIIRALDKAASALGIQVQITPQGGRRSRDAGTANHPTGEAADIQIVRNGRIVRPGEDTDLYVKLVELLVSNAAKRGVRPGIGGYDWGIHYDESSWRQRGNGIAGTWGSNFIQRGVRNADASSGVAAV